jgi:phage shock protein PspC (stress-responsive transcriptional regulator)
MKKTLTISISGFVFHIEEDAYDKLHRYLEAISAHFKGFEGREEVLADVEARIRELLQQKTSSSKEVITLADVDEVIGIMGQPSDFGPGDETSGDAAGQAPSYSRIPKRLYRDTERKTIGGVCGGLAAYFSIDPVWMRLIFIVSIFISGTGLLVYLILWLVVPEARTAAEKLEMRGEPVTVSNIEKSVSDEMHDLKDKFKGYASKARTTYRKEKEEFKVRHGNRLHSGLSDMARLLLRIFLVFVGIVVLFIGIALTVVYLSILFKFPVIAVMDQAGMQAFPLYALIDRIFASDADLRTFVTGLLIIIGIPLLLMLWGGIRLIFNLPRVRFLAGIATLAWICAFIITAIFGFKVANSFHYPGEFTREAPLQVTKADTLHLSAIQLLPEDSDWENQGFFHFPEMKIVISNDEQIIRGIPLIKIRTSPDSLARIFIRTSAKGAFRNQAEENAEKISYNWKQQNDTLYLSDSFILPDEEKWRKQEARVEVQLPEGTVVGIDKRLHPILGYHKHISRHERIGTLYYMSNEGLVKREN